MDNESKWSKWKDKHYVPLSRAIGGFGDVEINAKGMKIQLGKNTPKLRRKTIETMAAQAGPSTISEFPSLPKVIISVKIPA